MKQGGIFSAPNALGIVDSGSGVACNATNTSLVREVQAYLKANGAPLLKIDGVWQGCTASAFRKVFGRAYVTSDDIYKMTGKTCKSADTLPGGVLPWFTIGSINVCNDGSDGVPTGQGTGQGTAPVQECPAGQCWNDVLRTCVPDPFGLLCPKGQGNGTTPTTQQTQCPQGQVWNEMLKMCVPDLFGQGQGQGQAQLPPVGAKKECPSGTWQNPANPDQCIGATGITAKVCPSGTTDVMGSCIPTGGDIVGNLLGTLFGGGGQQPGTQPGSQPATPGVADLIGGITAAISSIFGAGSAAGGCAPGLVFNPATGQCVGPNGVSVPPGWTNPATPPAETSSPWGTMGYVIAGVLGIGAAAAIGWYVTRPKDVAMLDDDEEDLEDFLLAQELLLQEGGDEGGYETYDAYGYAANRRRRSRRSRR